MTLEEAIKTLVSHTKPKSKTITTSILNAQGKHIANDLYAPINVPTFNRAAMDGYAVRSQDTIGASPTNPIKLPVTYEILAGQTIDDSTQPDTSTPSAIRIMTGAKVPDGYGYNSIIRQEDTNYATNIVEIYKEVQPYANYSHIGEDIKENSLVIPKHTLLKSIQIGILASLGYDNTTVIDPLKVGVISTGEELCEPNTPLLDGKIYNSNKYMLASRLKELGACPIIDTYPTVVNYPLIGQPDLNFKDDPSYICDLMQSDIFEDVDMFITTGGVSVGKADNIPTVLEQLQADILFKKIDIKPGTPATASIWNNKPILSLSGNPFAALTTFELLFRPMLAQYMQCDSYLPKKQSAILATSFNKYSPRRRFLRAKYAGGQVHIPSTHHQSSVLSSMIDCNCFIDIPAGTESIEKGSTVQIVII
jgi:molybdopterin molybdotransferase